MTNLTITVDEEVLKRARIRALEQGTSVNALLRDYLDALAGGDPRTAATQSLLDSSRKARSRRGAARWTRDELHER
ncbi:MAG TPA: DUF6364 family protein [Thermoanaerobaculia bacterium]|nr:DUF6364 family protein [Thermoanaerobaculia bacterium]